MKKILFIIVAALMCSIGVGCANNNEKKELPYADAGIAREVWQTFIYEKTLDAKKLGYIDEEQDSAFVDSLRKAAEKVDSLVVSCVMIIDPGRDTIIDMFDIK